MHSLRLLGEARTPSVLGSLVRRNVASLDA